VVCVTEDLIARYLTRLRAGLRVPPERAEQILAEAEDHLRESAAAGAALGLTEADAQEAAIAAFGRVRAVTRAHRRPFSAALAEVGVAAMKLAAVYLLTVAAAGLCMLALERALLQLAAPPGWTVLTAPVDYARTIGVLLVSAAAGLALLAGCRQAGRRRARGPRWPGGIAPGALLGGYFPLAAAVCMLALVIFVIPMLRSVKFPGEVYASAPVMPAATSVAAAAVALGYAARMAWLLIRQRDVEEASHAG